ncbi:MAG: hypothetical protein HY331_02975 [Chloroflexi bacterium]|nr:hypothetical protein [Chloroflexota bacterium]
MDGINIINVHIVNVMREIRKRLTSARAVQWRRRLIGLTTTVLVLELLATGSVAAGPTFVGATTVAAASSHRLHLPFVVVGATSTAPVTAPVPATTASSRRPYAANSPWNTPIGPNPAYDPQSARYLSALAGSFGSDPTQYTYPVYEIASNTPLRTIKLSGTFSNVTDNGTGLTNLKAPALQIPIPAGARPARGGDAQFIIWNRETGDEWGFWKVIVNADGTYAATNGYHYNTNWSGVPPKGFISRGAGVPYLTGLIRPWEIAQGRIDHAIAFAYDYPTPEYVYPATKSDGSGSYPDMPEGTRLQLDPSLTNADFDRWGLSPTGKIIARALQEYGMIIIDKSGHPKIYAEYEATADWNGTLSASTISKIPYAAFHVIKIQ